jgi:hypothetical protein
LSDRVLKYLKEAITEASDDGSSSNIELQNCEAILAKIHALFDSNAFDDRISAGLAMEDLCGKM